MQGSDPVRSLDAWVTVGEIARSLHCSNPSTVTNWRKRYADFPAPVAGGSRPRFRWGSVLEWVLTYRRDWLEEHAPYLLESGHSRLVTAISVGLSTVENLPVSSSGLPGVRFAVAAAATLLAVDPDASDPDDPYVALAGDLSDDIRRIVVDAVEERGAGGVCEQIRDAFESSSTGGFHDPPAVVDLFASVSEREPRFPDGRCDVVSLGCGTGRTLARAARWSRVDGGSLRLWGYEIDAALASGAGSLLRAEGFDALVEQRDVLTDPPVLAGTSPSAVVLASPSLRRLGADGRTDDAADEARPDDPRWVVTSTGQRASVNTWVQVAFSLARSMTERKGGRSSAAVLLPAAWLGTDGREQRAVRALREWLAVERLLRAVAVAPVVRTSGGYDMAGLIVMSGSAEETRVVVVDASRARVRPTLMGPEFIGAAPGVFGVGVAVEGVSRFDVEPTALASAAAAGNADLRPEALRALTGDDDLVGVAPSLASLARREISPDSDSTSSSLHEAVERVSESIELLAEELAQPRHRLDRFGRNRLEEVRQRFEELEAIVRAQSDPESPGRG